MGERAVSLRGGPQMVKRKRGSFRLKTGFPIKKAWRTNILEENLAELKVGTNHLEGSYKPYQIVTLRVMPKD